MTKTVLVTGVSSGIGLAQARLFLENNWRVYGVDCKESPELAGDFHFLKRDLTCDRTPIYDWCQEIDVLCNTAGILDAYHPLLEQPLQEIQKVFAINYIAPVELTRLYLPQMIKRQSGIVLNMCSIASSLAGGGGNAYTSSKHALAGFTKQLALDYAPQGIQVFGLAPGAVKTAMTKADFEPGGMADWVANETPIKRWIKPDEVAAVTLLLASGKFGAMQGEIFKIDGGWSLK